MILSRSEIIELTEIFGEIDPISALYACLSKMPDSLVDEVVMEEGWDKIDIPESHNLSER